MALVDSLTSYWSLEESSGSALDAHGTNDLTDNNTVGTATGKVGNARDFERDNDEHFNRADNTDLSTGNIDFTFAFWVNFESLAADQFVITKGNGSSGEYVVEFNVGTGKFRVRVWGSTGFGDAGTLNADTAGTLSTATWYFVVMWHDATANTINIQVNNGTADSVSHTAGVFDGTADFYLGDYPAFPNKLDGLLDEVGFWKRVLTADERTELYNSGNGRDYAYISGGGGGATPKNVFGKMLSGPFAGAI